MKKLQIGLVVLFSPLTVASTLPPVYEKPVKLVTVNYSAIVEASGLVMSKQNPGIAWIHNDSGSSATVYGINLTDGSCTAKINMKGASNVDIEDIALGNYQGVETLFLADIGDNGRTRSSYYINVLSEPRLNGISGCKNIDVVVKKIKFAYPNNTKNNAEALMFNEQTQKLYIITKATNTEFFEFQTMDTSGSTNYLQYLGKFSLSTVTSADMSRDGEGLLIRTNSTIHEVRKLKEQDVIRFTQEPLVSVPAPSEPQGEAVTYDEAGNYYTISEQRNPPIYKIKRVISSTECLPPNIRATYSPDRKSITLSWQKPAQSLPINQFQVNNYKDSFLWSGTATSYTDNSLPGTQGSFSYYLYSKCDVGLSKREQYIVNIK
ncbi:Uncharacterised protein [Legionella busanensis]|uniref:Fibronectin type-III domain-containing protein n=1 Tax=Legionella busanensis TaxID=190655 RepID=A0A378JLF8_9GAMM|nr:hypothetical protein [Legionella busanensis]STX51571.1 Uncharacterised protein [Legionella busanensis]